MNNKTLDYLMRKVDSRRARRDSRDYEDSRRAESRNYEDGAGRRMRDSRREESRGSVDFEGSMDFRDTHHPKEWDYNEHYDSRVSRDSRDYRRSSDFEDDRDMRDYGKSLKLSKTDVHHWKQMLENEDGTRGPHYDMQQIIDAADKLGVKFDEYDDKEFCIAVNMMYSDYCKVSKKYVAPDKELAFFVDLAKAFLDDEDGPDASEKLALYFHCIVDA